jgi:MFS family permease
LSHNPENLLSRSFGFVRRQTHNYKVMLLRRALHAVAANLTFQYNSIYATMLGASPTQLGSIHSVANAVGALASIPAGWFIDRYRLKTTLLIGTVLLALSSLLYAVAPHWAALYAVMILFYIGMRVTCTSCTVIGVRDLKNEERGTSRGICRSLSSVVTLIAPILAAWMISAFGGIEIASLRSLYGVQLGVFVLIFVILLIFVREYKQHGVGRKLTPWKDLGVVFQQGPAIPRFLIMIALMEIPYDCNCSFSILYSSWKTGRSLR